MEIKEPDRRQPRVLPPRDPQTSVIPIIAADTMQEQGKGEIPSDVNGSYTGTPTDGTRPVQDADDL